VIEAVAAQVAPFRNVQGCCSPTIENDDGGDSSTLRISCRIRYPKRTAQERGCDLAAD